jgi:hypothetical protein
MSFEKALRELVFDESQWRAAHLEINGPLDDNYMRNLANHLSSELLEGPKLQVKERSPHKARKTLVSCKTTIPQTDRRRSRLQCRHASTSA